MIFALELLLLLLPASLVVAVPSWGGILGSRPQISIGSLVPGASFIEALGQGISYEHYRPKYLSIQAPERGLAGSAVIHENPSPPLFFINNQQLWQVTNATSMLHVNVLNVTNSDAHPAPLKLELGENTDGISGGVWRWRGTKLHFDLGTQTNKGLYFSCPMKDGSQAVYTSLHDMPAPEGCSFKTLHSFVNR